MSGIAYSCRQWPARLPARKAVHRSDAALLNSCAIICPLATAEVIAMTDSALGSGNRDTILNLAAELDALNNLGCPLS